MITLTDTEKEYIQTTLRQPLEEDDMEKVVYELFDVSNHVKPKVQPGHIGQFLYELGLPIEEATTEFLSKDTYWPAVFGMYLYAPSWVYVKGPVHCGTFDTTDEGELKEDKKGRFHITVGGGPNTLGQRLAVTLDELEELEDAGFDLYMGDLILSDCTMYNTLNEVELNGEPAPGIFYRLVFWPIIYMSTNARYTNVNWAESDRMKDIE